MARQHSRPGRVGHGAGPRGADRRRYGIQRRGLRLRRAPARARRPIPRTSGSTAASSARYGQDDRLSSYCAARAVMDVKGTPQHTAMAYLSNFEEVGSVNNTGAAFAVLELDVRAPASAPSAARRTRTSICAQALRASEVISADTNDGINPIFPQTSEPSGAARLGYGAGHQEVRRAASTRNSEFIAKIRGAARQERHRVADPDAEGGRATRAARSAGSSRPRRWKSSTWACRCSRCTRPSRCPRRSTSGASTGSWPCSWGREG